jgi:ribose 5-phosphate isomerase A
MSPEVQTAWKLEAARAAVAAIPSGVALGLGSGTTAELMLRALAERVRAGLRVVGVPTSERTRQFAAALGIPLTGIDDVATLDMSIDGADEVLPLSLDLIKGHGGALLHEKLIAAASRERVIIVDVSKLVRALGARGPVPVEVTPFGWRHTAERVAALGCRPVLRTKPAAAPGSPPAAAPTPGSATGTQATPFVTDGGNYILDCAFGSIAEPARLAAAIKALVGVVESGLFVGMTERVYVGGSQGVQVYERPR